VPIIIFRIRMEGAYTVNVGTNYDLPFAIAYGKLTWFLWVPKDGSHRHWRKINEDLEVAQKTRGQSVIVMGRRPKNKKEVIEKLGLWYDAEALLERQPHEVKILFNQFPVRFPKANVNDFEILLTAATLSPQVSWKDNTTWVRMLYRRFKNKFSKIAEVNPTELDYLLREGLSEAELQKIKIRRLGYHASVLVKAFQDYNDKLGGNANDLFEMPSNEAKMALLRIYGIGPKIAMFILQATHGDLSAPCLDTHVFRTAKEIGFIRKEMIPYNTNLCDKYFGSCNLCPAREECGTYRLMKFTAGSLLSSLLYYYDSQKC
jgi:endonuclease III